MSAIVISAPLRDQFLATSIATMICDESGKLLGLFVPTGPEPTPEEIDAQMSPDRKTYTTAEVLAYVKGLVP